MTEAKIRFVCIRCGKSLAAGHGSAGKMAKCPGCGTLVRIPGIPVAAPQAAAQAGAAPSAPLVSPGVAPGASRPRLAPGIAAPGVRAPSPNAGRSGEVASGPGAALEPDERAGSGFAAGADGSPGAGRAAGRAGGGKVSRSEDSPATTVRRSRPGIRAHPPVVAGDGTRMGIARPDPAAGEVGGEGESGRSAAAENETPAVEGPSAPEPDERAADASGGEGQVEVQAPPADMVEAKDPAAAAEVSAEGREKSGPAVRSRIAAGAGSRIGMIGRRLDRPGRADGGSGTAPKKQVVWILAAAGVLLLAGAGAVISLFLDREKRREAIETAVWKAEEAYGKGRFEDAAKAAKAASAKLKVEGSLFAPDRGQTLQKTVEAILADCKTLDETTGSLRESKDPATIKKAIEEKLAEASKSERRKSLRDALAELSKEADRRIEAARAAKIKEMLDAADRSYREGRFDEMAKALDETDSIIASSQTSASDAIRARIAEYRGYAKMVKEAEELLEKAARNDSEAREKLEKAFAEIAVTDEKKRPVRDRLQALVAKLPPKKSPESEKPPEDASEREVPAEADSIVADASSLEQIGQVLAKADYGISKYEGVDKARRGIKMSLGGRQVLVRFVKDGITFEADGLRALLPCNPRQMLFHISAPIKGILGLREQFRSAGLDPASGGEWRIAVKTPFPEPAIVREDGDTAEIFTRGRKYTARLTQRDAEEIKKANKAFEEAGSKLAERIKGDAETPEEIREVVAKIVESMYKPADQEDFLPMNFCRQLLTDGYLERNIPGGGAKFRADLDAMAAAYARLDEFHQFAAGKNDAGDEFVGYENLNGRTMWRFYYAKENRTAFAARAPEDDTKMFVITTFDGKHDSWPKDDRPAEIAMSNGLIGPVAWYLPATGEFKVDEDGWKAAASLLHMPGRTPAWMGPPGWNFPPHVVVTDSSGRAAAIVTARGRLDMPDFSGIKEEKARMEAHDAFVARMAEVLPDSGHLHLFFRYFFQYVLDSPVETSPNLLGNRHRCGDEHQTYHEFLDRKIAGRFCGDCDDLAEFYQMVTRKQGKLSFVVGVPGHATCGFVVKGDQGYNCYFLDTGPPRMFFDASLNKVLEMGVRSYDREGNLRFDPESMQFLFRFAGEQTRTPYYLASRMFVDPQYAEIMERVQGYWHFHYYALGIETMSKMLETDKEAANFFELSGLYRSVCKFDKAVELMYEGMKHMKDKQPLSELNQYLHIAGLHKMAREKDKAFAVLRDRIAPELKRLEADRRDSLRYLSLRFEAAAYCAAVDQPWLGWGIAAGDTRLMSQFGGLREYHSSVLAGIYSAMKRLEGRELSEAEKTAASQLQRVLDWHFANAHFRKDDKFMDIQVKYGIIASYYAGKYGEKKVIEELLKKGPYPSGERNHMNRDNPEEEDWKWMRISVPAYRGFIAKMLDKEESDKLDPQTAARLIDACIAGAEQARKYGSLASMEYDLLAMRILRAAIVKDWKDAENAFKVAKEKDWGRLYAEVSEALGEAAWLMTPQEFEAQMKKFASYVSPKPHYFNVVYEAFRKEAYEQARIAARVAMSKFPDDKDMKREAEYLENLISEKQKK